MTRFLPDSTLTAPPRSAWKRRQRLTEGAARLVVFAAALLSVVTTLAIVAVLVGESIPFFQRVPLAEYLGGTRWAPLLEPRSFGVLPLIAGTVLVAGIAAVVAIPLGLGSAIYLSEYAPERLRRVAKAILEVLAGIPTVVYGYFALVTVTPILQRLYPPTQIFNAASAGIVMGIMILPMVSSLCEDALAAVPTTLRDGGYALGSTRYEVAVRVVLPAALSGVIAAFLLAIARAVGETMIVTLAAGANPRLTLNPFEGVQTMTAYIAQISMGDVPAGTIEYRTIFAVGLTLLVLTAALNLIAHAVVRRYRQEYE